jgi:hypothetical protein
MQLFLELYLAIWCRSHLNNSCSHIHMADIIACQSIQILFWTSNIMMNHLILLWDMANYCLINSMEEDIYFFLFISIHPIQFSDIDHTFLYQ